MTTEDNLKQFFWFCLDFTNFTKLSSRPGLEHFHSCIGSDTFLFFSQL